MKKSLLTIVALCATLIASAAHERPASNGETRITKQEYLWLAHQLPLSIIPQQPISCENGKKVKVNNEIYEELKSEFMSLQNRINSAEMRYYAEINMITRLTLDEFDNSTIFQKGKPTLCVGKRYRFLEKFRKDHPGFYKSEVKSEVQK